jgi:hypothetical protein
MIFAGGFGQCIYRLPAVTLEQKITIYFNRLQLWPEYIAGNAGTTPQPP